MGIKDLLPSLKSITKAKNIRDYAGQTVAIDGYCWLHQGAYTCAMELAYGRGTSKLIQYCQKKLQMLITFKVTPILIFDGARLIMKSKTEDERKKNRDEHRIKAEEFLKQGNSVMAHKMFSIAVDITPEMAYMLVQVAQQMSVQYIVAPYEADAQLAYMYLQGLASVVITEDSDLLAFGVKKCFFKMDQVGNGQEVDLDNLQNAQELNFQTFTTEMLLITCILSGCDYLESIKGIGFKKAHKLVYENGKDIKNILKKIRLEGKQIVPKDYETNFDRALLTFKFQRVYCPKRQSLVHLNDPETHELGAMLAQQAQFEGEDLKFLGMMIQDSISQKIARCEIDPQTHEPYAETIAKRRQLEEAPTKVVYKKNTTNKKGVLPKKDTNQPISKFFGTKKTVQRSVIDQIELADHDDLVDEIKLQPSFPTQALTQFSFKNRKQQSQEFSIVDESTEIKRRIVGSSEVSNIFQSPQTVSKYFTPSSEVLNEDDEVKIDDDESWTLKRPEQVQLGKQQDHQKPLMMLENLRFTGSKSGNAMQKLIFSSNSLQRKSIALMNVRDVLKDTKVQLQADKSAENMLSPDKQDLKQQMMSQTMDLDKYRLQPKVLKISR